MGSSFKRLGGAARGRRRYRIDLQGGGRASAADGALAGQRHRGGRRVRARRGRRHREQIDVAVGGQEGLGRDIYVPSAKHQTHRA